MTKTGRTAVKRRKEATQERSRAKVQLILETTLAMLNEGPADRITTTEIAKRAGISIGSLYQFFPNKETIFYELYSQWLKQTLDTIDEASKGFDGTEPLDQLSNAIFDSLAKGESINSPGHWQLLRAMGSTEELVALEAEHNREVFQRTLAFQRKFGREIPQDQALSLSILQGHVMIGCLAAVAQVGSHTDNEPVLEWGRKIMSFVYDINRLSQKKS
ncbi:MAG: TetR/AcrR family transcriptional regulator [Cohaesibacter sp.]|nr:TetR/AcrR family transcriptional regulator [Cohaesibacter sp.]